MFIEELQTKVTSIISQGAPEFPHDFERLTNEEKHKIINYNIKKYSKSDSPNAMDIDATLTNDRDEPDYANM